MSNNTQKTNRRPREQYSPSHQLETRTVKGEMRLILGEQEVMVQEVEGKIIIPDNPYAGTFTGPTDAADWVFTDGNLPINTGSKVRRNFLDLNQEDKARLAAAFNHVHSLGYIDEFAQMHLELFPWPPVAGKSVHLVPHFLPWHRWMIREMEKLMQKFDPLVTIPYWDSALEIPGDDGLTDLLTWDGPLIGEFLGGENNQGGFFDHWDITRIPQPKILLPQIYEFAAKVRDADDYRQLRSLENSRIHTGGHDYIGGTMTSRHSPLDPLFYFHHCNVDRIWALWQINHPEVLPQYSSLAIGSDHPYFDTLGIDDQLYTSPSLQQLGIKTVRQVLDHRAYGYRYAHDQRLEDYHQSRPQWQGDAPLLWGDPGVFTIAPQKIETQSNPGKWKTVSFQLINDTDTPVEVEIERFPEAPQGAVNGFVWFPLKVSIPPNEKHQHFVIFAPQSPSVYYNNLKIKVDPKGPGSPKMVTIDLFGTPESE